MQTKKIYSFDLGLNNVGFSAIETDDYQEDVKILELGTYVFNSPLVDVNKPKDGYKQAQRGNFRRQRRTIQRRSARKRGMYRLLSEIGFLPVDAKSRTELLCKNFDGDLPFNPYILRERALTEPLTPHQLGRVLTHLCNHRGFLSPRAQRLVGVADDLLANQTDGKDETGQLLKQIQKTRSILQEGGFPTIGAYYAARVREHKLVRLKTKPNRKHFGVKRPSDKRENFKKPEENFFRPDRHMIKEEFRKIVAFQKQYHPLLTDSTIAKLEKQIFDQRPIEDPKERGKCIYFPNENRMYKASMPAQKFVIAQSLANLEIIDGAGESRKLTAPARKLLCEVLMQGDCTWAEARDILKLERGQVFSREPLGRTQKGKQERLRGNQTAVILHGLMGAKWEEMNHDERTDLVNDLIGFVKSETMSQAERKFKLLQRHGFSKEDAAMLATEELPKGTLGVSLKAAKMLTPLMLSGMSYHQAAAHKGFNHTNPNPRPAIERLLPEDAAGILHPGVRCSVQNAFRVINALLDKHGKPDAVHIELARDVAQTAEQREEEEARIRKNEAINKAIRDRIRAVGKNPYDKNNQIRLKLFDECGGKLPYEPNAPKIASDEEALSDKYEIDHIVPRSHELSDALTNFVLCSAELNRAKSGRTPYQAFGQTPEWKEIIAHVNGIKSMDSRKRQRILAKELPQDFLGRHLAATGYIAKEIQDAVKLIDGKIEVIVTPGRITAELRRRWELSHLIPLHPDEEAKVNEEKAKRHAGEEYKVAKKNRSNYKHHALDALVIGLTTRSALIHLSNYFKYGEEHGGKKNPDRFTHPDKNLKAKVVEALENMVVVHKPDHSFEGQLHEQTARKPDASIPNDAPNSVKRVGSQMIRFDENGKPYQAYDLGNNHHAAIFKRVNPKTGKTEWATSVRPLFDVALRRAQGLPAIDKTYPEPGYEFVIALFKGDMVRMRDGQIGLVAKFSATAKEGVAIIVIWHSHVAQKLGKINKDNPYLIANLQSVTGPGEIESRILFSPIGDLIREENFE
jgi:CRISPR-associated endonuclease Csn1